jgi:excisionase family DNA binding protein
MQNAAAELVTLREAARRLGLGTRQLYRAARDRGEIAVYDIGGWPRVRWLDVLAWVESQRRPDSEEAS